MKSIRLNGDSKIKIEKIIEKTGDVPLSCANAIAGPLNIQEAEEWESRLNHNKIKYILAQCFLLTRSTFRGKLKIEKEKGYYLFASKKDFNVSETEAPEIQEARAYTKTDVADFLEHFTPAYVYDSQHEGEIE